MRALLLVVAAGTGCIEFTAGTTAARGHATGAGMELAIGDPGMRATGEVVIEQLAKDRSKPVGAMYGSGVGVSLPGMLWGDEDWARWVDLGGELGYDLGLQHGLHGFARVYAGGWLDVRLQRRTHDYLVVRLQARRAAYTGDLENETELLVGLGWAGLDPGHAE